MCPVDVIHIIKNIGYIKRMTPTASLKNPSSKCLYERHLIVHLCGGGAANLITPEIISCQSLMPHVKFVMLHRKYGLFVRKTSKIEGCASFIKHVGDLIRLAKSNMSHNICNGLDFKFYEVIVQISNNNYVVNINMKYIYTRSKSISKSTVKHNGR